MFRSFLSCIIANQFLLVLLLGCRIYLQRLSGHHPLCQPIESPAVSEDHQLAEMGAGHLLLPVLRWAVDPSVLPRRFLEDMQADVSKQLICIWSITGF